MLDFDKILEILYDIPEKIVINKKLLYQKKNKNKSYSSIKSNIIFNIIKYNRKT